MKRVVIIFISVSLYFVQFLLSQNLVPVNYSNIYGFEPNMGQIGDLKDEKIKEILFFTKHNGIDIFVHSSGVSYVIKSIEKKNDTKKEKLAHFSSFDRFREESKISWAKVDLRFLEAEVKPQNIEYSDPLPGYTNYYLAHCPDGILFVPSYKVVRIKNVYPGIDWIWKIGEDGLIHHEFEVEPYASVEKIKFEAKFAQVCLDDNGKSVKFSTPIGEIKDGEVSAWNDLGKVEASYVINDGIEETKIISFDLKNYMPKGKLIIDPPLARVWATYYGGNNADAGYSITVDVNGNVYITGETDGLFPLYDPGGGAYYQGSSSMWEIFILKFNNVGVRQWATYYGGSWYDHGYSIATDANGNVFITGKTQSSNFPLQDSSGGAYYQSTLGGDYDAFILKFNNLGVRQWATYYGGSSEDIGYSIATDPNGNIFVTGATKSTDFPRYNPSGGAYYQDSKGDGGTTYSDIFILKFSNSGQRLWATYYGGNSYEIGYSIATDANGNVFVTGVTNSFSGFSLYDPGGGAYYQTDTNGDDAFILKFNNSGVRLWATRFTGTGAAGGADEARSITIDPNGNVLITGTTTSGNFPIHNPGGGAYVQGGTTNVYSHAFIAKFSNSGQQLWTTCYGGHYREIGHSIATDSRGNIYVVGETESSDLPTYNPGGNVYFQGNLAGNYNAFILKFSSSGVRLWATYYGGNDYQYGYSIATDANGSVFVTGNTKSSNFPTYNPGGDVYYQGSRSGYDYDAFVLKFFGSINRTTAATYWSNTSSWSSGEIPDRNSDVDINHNMNLDQNAECYSLKFNNGKITTGNYSIKVFSGEVQGAGAGKFVDGTLIYPVLTTGSKRWETGQGTDYIPLTINFSSLTGSGDVSVSVLDRYNVTPGSGVGSNKVLRRFYRINQSGLTSFNANLELSYTDSDVSEQGITDESSLRVFQWDGTQWRELNVTSRDINNNKIIVSGVTSFSDFVISSTGDAPLPVKVKSVMAKVSGGKVKLIIETATEEEGLIGFRIYKGESPDVFSIVGTYENDIRLRAKGTSGFGSVYEWEDFQIENGKRYFYRVSAVSRDGERMIDKVIEVNVDMPKKFALYQNYPNPFNPTTTIEFDIAKDAHVKLEIFNLSGEKVSEIINKKLEAGRYSIVVDFSNMPSGIYFYKLIADEFVEVKRMVFLK